MIPAWGMTRYARHLSLVLLEPLDQPVRGAIVLQFCVILGEFRKNLLRELLAEFNTPLVVAVDVPVLMRMLAKRKKGYAALGYKF